MASVIPFQANSKLKKLFIKQTMCVWQHRHCLQCTMFAPAFTGFDHLHYYYTT